MKGFTVHFMGVAMILLCVASSCMAQLCKGKDQWPELVGVDGKVAAQIIQRENPLVKAVIVKEGTSVIENFDCRRVWVWVSKTNGTVVQTPTIG